jgi:hypothetical protein
MEDRIADRMNQIYRDQIDLYGGTGTRKGALKGWKTRRAHMAEARSATRAISKKKRKPRKKSGSKRSKKFNIRFKRSGCGYDDMDDNDMDDDDMDYGMGCDNCPIGYGVTAGMDYPMGYGVRAGYGNKKGARRNPWLQFLKEYRAQRPACRSQAELMKKASVAYQRWKRKQ